MYDLSDHEDVDVHLEFSDRGCHDIFTHSFDHDSDSPIIDLSKPPIFDDPSSDEVETPQAIEALQLKLMVMSSSHNLEGNSSSDKKYLDYPQYPHHSLVHIENQSNSLFSHPPPESHDTISHELEESYVASIVAK